MKGKYFFKMNEESHQRLKANYSPQKVAAIISMQEQMDETRAWKQSRGLKVQSDKCQLCGEVRETVINLLSRCKMRQQGNIRRDTNALKMLVTE